MGRVLDTGAAMDSLRGTARAILGEPVAPPFRVQLIGMGGDVREALDLPRMDPPPPAIQWGSTYFLAPGSTYPGADAVYYEDLVYHPLPSMLARG